MFTSKLLSNAPQIATRRALLVLDLQNDFVKPDGGLFVKNIANSLPQITDLARTFRDTGGEVIWVQTVFDERRPAANEGTGGEIIVLDDSAYTTDSKNTARGVSPSATNTPRARGSRQPQSTLASSSTSDNNNKKNNTHSSFPEDREAFLTVSDNTSSSAERRCCLPNSKGFQFPAPILSAIDYSKDTVLVKSDYSAFQSPNLVLSIRTRFVTEVFICGSLSNISVYATVVDAVRHGLSVTLIEDCLGYRDFARHKEAMRRMADIMGANGITSGELIEGQQRDGAKEPSPAPTDPLPGGVEEKMGSLGVSPSQSDSGDLDMSSSTPPPTSRRRRLDHSPGRNLRQHRPATRKRKGSDDQKDVKTEKEPAGLSEHTNTTTHSATQLSTSESVKGKPLRKQKTSSPVNFGPGDRIGAGDSRIIYDLDLPPDAFQLLREEVNWQKMYHMTGQVPRLVAVQGDVQQDKSVPIYRHPADESPPLFPFTNTVDMIRVSVEKLLGHPLNHVLIQLYRSGEDRISEHSDKTLDVVRGSNICNVSLGAERAMTLRTKADAKDTAQTEASAKNSANNTSNKESISGRQSQRVPMPHNSLFVLGEVTNMKWLHAIRPDKRPQSTKSAEELAFNGERISLTFRHIGTFINPKSDTIWGQGASSKTKENAGKIVHGDSPETELMIRAFGQENRQTEYDWDEHYGCGFDVVNFVTTSAAKLVLSGDNLLDLRIKLGLVENGIRYDVVRVDELPRGFIDAAPTQKQSILLDPDGTTLVTGDLSILTHIAHHLRGQDTPDPEHQTNGITLKDRLNAADELLDTWRQRTNDELEPVHSKLSWFETLLNGNLYLTGRRFGLDDCALWPVLKEIVGQKGVISENKFPSLMGYYRKVSKRACVKQVLGESTSEIRSDQ